MSVARSESDIEHEWNARLELPDAFGSARVIERHSGDALRLETYFSSLAKRWRGWDGEESWEANGMKFGAHHDGVGHVALHVEVGVDRAGRLTGPLP